MITYVKLLHISTFELYLPPPTFHIQFWYKIYVHQKYVINMLSIKFLLFSPWMIARKIFVLCSLSMGTGGVLSYLEILCIKNMPKIYNWKILSLLAFCWWEWTNRPISWSNAGWWVSSKAHKENAKEEESRNELQCQASKTIQSDNTDQ